MSKPASPASRAYLRKLRNPYATEQIDDGVVAAEPNVESSLQQHSGRTDERKSEVEVLQNPYASLSEEPRKHRSRVLRSVARPTCSKADFRAGCKHVFRQYTPAPEKGWLREEHTAFIERNEERPPEVRHALLRELQRFDLSDIPGIQPQLNREKDALTEEKLKILERKVLRDE